MSKPQKVETLTVVIKYSPRCAECDAAIDPIYKIAEKHREHTKIIGHIDNVQTFALEQITTVREAHKHYVDSRRQLEKLVEGL